MLGKKNKRDTQDVKVMRIRDWKGLLANEPRKTKYTLFALLLLFSTGMTFMQLGFIGLGQDGAYLCYVFGLLAPITACSLLLGKGAGTLYGILNGIVLLVHARIQPLDFFERYFVSFLNAVVLYAFAGFLLGLLLAIALRKNPHGFRRGIRFLFVSFFVACLVTVAFMINATFDNLWTLTHDPTVSAIVTNSADSTVFAATVKEASNDWLLAMRHMGGSDIQVFADFLLMFAVMVLTDHLVNRYMERRTYESIRASFGTRLFVTVSVVYVVVQAGIFVVSTRFEETSAAENMDQEIDFILYQLEANRDHALNIVELPEFETFSGETISNTLESDSSEHLIHGYNEDDGTVLVFTGGYLTYTSSDAYDDVLDCTTAEIFGERNAQRLDEISESGEMLTMLYGMQSTTQMSEDSADEDTQGSYAGELGYMCAGKKDNFMVLMSMPSSLVFFHRSVTVRWGSLLALSLAIAAYIAAAHLLRKVVVTPIDRTNSSLAKITAGNLDVLVSEVESVEFASLSLGINTTVDSLKGLIDEAERRMERDLATAKAIQESALPRTFPPFPEVDAFDIYASMDAAKEVGGDFYDFFLIDDHTLGFLIADVSGKGIPGALFMMAAKTEIENYLSTGMGPAEAIASANHRLCANNDAGMFVTVWAATLDWDTGLLTYVNAGHNFPLLRHGHDGDWEWLKKKCGLFLGTFETAKYRQETLTLSAGDELLLYTDGVNEAFSVDDEEFGNDRLESFLRRHAYLDPKSLVKRLRAEVAAWAEGAEQSDDITILALEYGAAPEATGSITLPATLDNLDKAMNLVCAELERRLCPASVLRKVEVAFEELFVNVCRYAYAEEPEPGEVTVSYVYSGNPRSITVELRDQGMPFDPLTRKDPTKPTTIQEAKIGGLGIFMVKKSMDEVTYRHDGDSNVVAFRKDW